MINKYALLIGCENFTDKNISNLTKPKRNVIDFAEVLQDEIYGFQMVETLIDATEDTIIDSISNFAFNRKRKDLLLLYYAGHGFKVEEELFMAAQNSKRDLERKQLSNTISARFIAQEMAKKPVERQILILDCCASGAFNAVGIEAPGKTIVVLTASDANEFAWEAEHEADQHKHTIFTRHLIEGLTEIQNVRDTDGSITSDELYSYIYKKLQNSEQNPLKLLPFGRQKGKIILADKPPVPAEYWHSVVFEYARKMADDLSHWRDEYVPLPLVGEPITLIQRIKNLSEADDQKLVQQISDLCPLQRMMHEVDSLVILGGGGTGKTTALEFYAWSRFIQLKEIGLIDKLPVLVNLAGMDKEVRLMDVISAQTGLIIQDVKRYILDGAIELLADGLNEIPEDAVTHVLKQLDEFLRRENKINNRLVITSRPIVAPWRSLGIRAVEIAPLKRESVTHMIDRITPNPIAAQLLKDRIAVNDALAWRNRTSVGRMVGLPLVIKMLSTLAEQAANKINDENADVFQLPPTRGKLFYQWINYHLEIYEDKKQGVVNSQLKLNGLIRLATYMLHHGLGTVINRKTILDVCVDYLDAAALDELIAANILKQHGKDKITWWHQGIRDSCAASHLYKLQVQGVFPKEYLLDRDWDDPFVYFAGRLSVLETNKLIETLITDDPNDPGPQDRPFLAARCYMETRQVHDLDAIKPRLLEALSNAHRRTQEITGESKELESLIREGLEEKDTFLGRVLLGKILQIMGEHAKAEIEIKWALKLPAPSFNDEIDALCGLGSNLRRRGNHSEAVTYFCDALNRAKETNKHGRDDFPYYELGYLFEKEGLTQLALKCFDLSYKSGEAEAQRLQKLGNKRFLRVRAYANFANTVKMGLLIRCHQFDDALRLTEPMLTVFKDAGQQQFIRNTYYFLMLLYLGRFELNGDKHDLEQARQFLDLGKDKEAAFNRNPTARANIKHYEALFSLASQDYQGAIKFAMEAREIAVDAEEGDMRAEILHTLGRAFAKHKEQEMAIQTYLAAIDSNPDKLNRWGIARSLRDLADMQMTLVLGQEMGDSILEEVVQNLETAKQLFEILDSLEVETCRPIKEKLQRSLLTPAQYDVYAENLPRLKRLLPKVPTYFPFLQDGLCKELLEDLKND